jgi:AbrB family looped-hinge helix DNA binding protein
MKKYPKIVQCDKRGQIVIPKDIRQELEIDEGSAFWMFSITDQGILLKRIPDEELSEHSIVLNKIKEKSSKVGIDKEHVEQTIKEYKKKPKGKLEEI